MRLNQSIKSTVTLIVFTLLWYCPMAVLLAQPLAFPGADGFGKNTKGGRGGNVVLVTNLNDDGPGSLRAAIETDGRRTIVFEVSGTIALESELKVRNGHVTIAGQSAPGDGICIKNYPMVISSNDVIIRYLRFRLGDDKGQQEDAFKAKGRKDVIIDHCSMSWSVDEAASFYGNENFTLQYCIVSESLNNSIHKKGEHGYGGIWGGVNATFHHNLIMHHKSRMPRFSGSSTTANDPDELVDFRNNVIYNWEGNSTYGGETGQYNVVNNYYKAGPATEKDVKDRILEPYEPYGKFYVTGNYVEGFPEISNDNWAGGVQCDQPESAKAELPFEVMTLAREQSAEEAYSEVLRSAGASLCRDAVDRRLVEEVRDGSATFKNGIIDKPEDVGGWPVLQSSKAPKDSDGDGMPDKWEKKNGLDPNNREDHNDNDLNEVYTNLEVYLNGLIKQ